MKVLTAPDDLAQASGYKIFLAGSIEQDTAERWQDKIIEAVRGTDLCILNPRRAAWDPTWVQNIENPQFKQQVLWELAGQNMADLIVMYFDPNTKAPITLLELGLFHQKNLLVLCPEGYWRKGNVDIVCQLHDIKQAKDFDDLINQIKGYGGRSQAA